MSGRLLQDHPNLYLSIKRTHDAKQNAMVDSSGQVDPEWLEVFTAFPDRFVLGSDQFYLAPGLSRDLPDGAEATVDLLSVLPLELSAKFGFENARYLFGLE
ncbi:MAG: hypothetical protein GY868_20445 [Deltaproteobacteria bacterium]|nr:hypothetical protein [Deltaproteobacteria bacterium]